MCSKVQQARNKTDAWSWDEIFGQSFLDGLTSVGIWLIAVKTRCQFSKYDCSQVGKAGQQKLLSFLKVTQNIPRMSSSLCFGGSGDPPSEQTPSTMPQCFQRNAAAIVDRDDSRWEDRPASPPQPSTANTIQCVALYLRRHATVFIACDPARPR